MLHRVYHINTFGFQQNNSLTIANSLNGTLCNLHHLSSALDSEP